MTPQTALEKPLPASVERFLEEQVRGYRGPGSLRKCGYGQSNPTYRLSALSEEYVIRAKPGGVVLPKAHWIEREFRVLRALENTPVPVPRVYALCEDPAVFDAMNEAIARLHAVDLASLDLPGFGGGERFLSRQVSLWTKQYRASESDPVPAMENLIAWLPAHLPPDEAPRLFHGDLRLDNLVFHPTEPRVVAFLDWELSTIGDRTADFAYHAMSWRIDAALFPGYADLDRQALGIPEERMYLAAYCARRGIELPADWPFYLAFSFFRLAGVPGKVMPVHRTPRSSAARYRLSRRAAGRLHERPDGQHCEALSRRAARPTPDGA